MQHKTEIKAANTLLQEGVDLLINPPLVFWWWKPKIYQPSLGNLARISKIYLETGITQESLSNISVEQGTELLAKNAFAMCRIIAIAMFRGYWMPKIFNKIVARWLMYKMNPQRILGAVNILLLYGGTSDFLSTTRLLKSLKITGKMGQ